MLLAAMILGLVGGISYFVGGGAAVIAPGAGINPALGIDSVEWWMIALIAIGVVGVLGGALARVNPGLAGTILLLAAAAAISVGFASYEEAVDMVTYNNFLMPPNLLPQHAFSGPLIYLPIPLLSLVIGGALALSSGKKPASD